MSATVVVLRQDPGKIVSEAIALHAGLTAEDLLARHRRLTAVFGRLWTKAEWTPAEADLVRRLTTHMDSFHAMARRAGVDVEAIEAFNRERDDWKSWKAYRAALPPSRRL